ncbi:hypothetical protein CLV59_102518 [Chitinophaga dinghuensis]|uniref:Glycosyl transferase family 1 n=1 Tax=Chitinophaga dinghuensis TaxID=1539050 RepID=A0A327W8U6_9BACT|nr:hypothetical protein [Chitinophaga dinghuensis]RAJ85813.1 hypothetical protein CLV59_102518 [Chitinophaga dinghuensis]
MIPYKKILFVSTVYFDYYKQIKKEIEALGIQVDFLPDNAFENTWLKQIKHRLSPGLIQKRRNRYHKEFLDLVDQNNYDCLFVIRGEDMTPEMVAEFRKKHPDATTILYEWDSLKNFNYSALANQFDKVYSFDTADCQAMGYAYQPLFALDYFYKLRENRPPTPASIDLLFVGYNHGNRLEIIRKIKQAVAGTTANIYTHLYTPKMMFWLNMLNGQRKFKSTEVSTRKIAREDFGKLLINSRLVLDVQSPTQTGLTIRTFETLAAGCHLVTTNVNIKNEPFYDEKYITVLNGTMEDTIKSVLAVQREESTFIPFADYSLSKWVLNVLK